MFVSKTIIIIAVRRYIISIVRLGLITVKLVVLSNECPQSNEELDQRTLNVALVQEHRVG